jgi:hypothetical protein
MHDHPGVQTAGERDARPMYVENRRGLDPVMPGKDSSPREALNKSSLRLRYTAYWLPDPEKPVVFRPLTQGAIAALDLFSGSLVKEVGRGNVLYDALEMDAPPVGLPWAQLVLNEQLGPHQTSPGLRRPQYQNCLPRAACVRRQRLQGVLQQHGGCGKLAEREISGLTHPLR